MKRSSGVLMSVTSLPSRYGIGTLGKSAYQFVDFLQEAGQSYWQLLPMGPTSYGDSPYSSLSSFAGNPYMIDLDLLVKDKLLKITEVTDCEWGDDPAVVDYGKIYQSRFRLLQLAFERGRDKYKDEIEQFHQKNQRWLDTYALYMSVKKYFNMQPWPQWPDVSIRLHKAEAVKKYTEMLSDDIAYYTFIQFLFYRQWDALKTYAHDKGIEFIGDIPIYVAMDSADVWSEPEFFQLNEENIPVEVAGVPPDAFTADGQLWGNPLYNWDKMAKDGFGWWIRRIDGALSLYDVIRIDHFRGLESYWAVPYGEKTARNGHWVKGPGIAFCDTIKAWFSGIRVIAEDLGYLTPEVRELLKGSAFPGMKILEFAFNYQGGSDYLPYACVPNSVCYIGTHDNETLSGWLKNMPAKDKAFARKYMNITEEEGWTWGMLRTGMGTASNLFIMQMQDLLDLGPESRMNTPGKPAGNWQWRMLPDAIKKPMVRKLAEMTRMYGRFTPVKNTKKEKAEKVSK